MPAGAGAAPPAARDEAHDDVVAGLHARDTAADLLDGPRTFVAADGGHGDGDVTGDDVLVRMAQAGGAHAHEDLLGLRVVELDFLDLPRLVHSPQHGGCRLHGRSFLTRMRTPRLTVPPGFAGSAGCHAGVDGNDRTGDPA